MRWWAAPILLVLTSPTLAEERGGMRSFLIIGGGFTGDSNADFETVPKRSFDPVIELRFGLISNTRRQHFEATGEVDFRGASVEDGRILAAYSIESSQANLSAGIGLSRVSGGGFVGLLHEETSEVIALAPRGGDMTSGGAWVTFEGGLKRAVGYELGLRRDRLTYSGLAANGDVDRAVVDAALVLRFSQMTEARLEAGRETSDTGAPFSQSLRNTHVRAGLGHQMTASTRLSFGLGHRRLRGTRGRVRLERSGAELDFKLDRNIGDRSVYADVRVQQQPIGRRTTLRVGQEWKSKDMSLSGWLGATRQAAGRTDVIGGLSIAKTQQGERFGMAVERSVSVDPESQDTRISDRLGLNWRTPITASGSLDLRADYLRTSATAAEPERRGARAQAIYRHALRSDWGVQAGLRYRVRQDGGGPKVASRAVFLTFEKRFEARR